MTVTGATIQQTDLSIGSPADRWTLLDRILIAILVLCTFALYLRTRTFAFIDYDDHLYVWRNVHVLGGLTFANIRWAMTAVVAGNWHPLTLLVELTLSSLFGPSAATFHVTSSVIHTANVVLLYVFFRAATGRLWPAFFTALLWGIHPLRVESVVWISELKDVLCGLLWLLCMLAYLKYSARRSVLLYLLVLALHGLALTAKPMAATLPGALLVLDFWPIGVNATAVKNLKWWTNRILEKLPLFAFSITDLIYAMRFQRQYTLNGAVPYSLASRFKDAPVYCVEYLRDIFAPHHLILFHPHPSIVNQYIPAATSILAGTLLLIISALVLFYRRSQPYMATGWFWFLGTLIPVLGFVRLGEVSRADRYTYLPSIGITFAVVWLISDLASRRYIYQILAAGAAAVVTVALVLLTHSTVGRWKDSATLFEYMGSVDPDNPLALTYHVDDLWQKGLFDQAIEAGKHVLSVVPHSATSHGAYGRALLAAGRYSDAVDEFATAIRITPGEDSLWDVLGITRAQQAGKYSQDKDTTNEKIYRNKAIVDFKTAILLNPDATDSREHMALELAALGQLDDAIQIWNQLLALLPTDAQANGDLADALRLKGDLAGAVQHYRAALANGSKNPDWEVALAYLVATSPGASTADVEPLVAIAKDACDQTNNRKPGALDAYAACLARVGRFDDAVATAQQAIAQANADHMPAIAAGIEKRLAFYQRQQPYVAGEK